MASRNSAVEADRKVAEAVNRRAILEVVHMATVVAANSRWGTFLLDLLLIYKIIIWLIV